MYRLVISAERLEESHCSHVCSWLGTLQHAGLFHSNEFFQIFVTVRFSYLTKTCIHANCNTCRNLATKANGRTGEGCLVHSGTSYMTDMKLLSDSVMSGRRSLSFELFVARTDYCNTLA